jgi:hypothetical protein
MEAWLDEVKRELKLPEYFGPIVLVLQAECPMETQHLTAHEMKKWKYARVRSTKHLLEGRLLYRTTADGERRLCIPTPLIDEIFQNAHDAQSGGGHNGVEKRVDTVSPCFDSPRIFEIMRASGRGCSTCLGVKPRNKLPAGLLSPWVIPAAHGERLNIDFVIKLLATSIGKETIITIIDGLS